MSDRAGTPGPDIRLWLEAPGLDPETVQIAEMRLDAAISKPTEIDLDLVTEDPFGLDYQAILGQKATLHVSWAGDLQQQRHGVIADVEDTLEPQAGVYRHRVRLVPRLWRLSLRSRLTVHADIDVPEAIRRTLVNAGLIEDLDFELRLGTTYPKRDFIIQYRESDLDFVRRLTEHWGISFFFENRDGRDVVVFADANIFWRKGNVTDTVEIHTGGLKKEVYDVRGVSTLIPKRYVLRDYNFHYPKVGLQSVIEFENGVEGETVEYGANFRDEREGQILTRARRDEILTHACLYRGECAEPVLAVGSLFRLTGNSMYEGERFLVIEQKARYTQTTSMSGTGERPSYTASCVAADASIDFRPRRTAAKPRIDGVLHGIVEPQVAPGAGGEDGKAKKSYGEVDAQGCYRVRLLVDAPLEDGGHAYPVVRLSQPSGGQGYGFHFPLRPGTEVMLSFIEGDPDRPIITGTAPNPSDRTPVAAENRSRNVIRTESGNQIDFDDTEDGTRIKLETPFKGTALQLGAPNGPEEGVWIQSNGSIEQVSSITYGVSTLMQTSWSMFDFGQGLIRHNRAMKPRLDSFDNAINYMTWGSQVAAAAYGVATAARDAFIGFSDSLLHDSPNDEATSDIREQLLEQQRVSDSGTPEPTAFGVYLAAMRAYYVARGGQDTFTRVTGETYLAILAKSEVERTSSEIAYKAEVERDCAGRSPDGAFLRFHVALVAFQQRSEQFREACEQRNEAIAAGLGPREKGEAKANDGKSGPTLGDTAQAEMNRADLPGAAAELRQAAKRLSAEIAQESKVTGHESEATTAAREAVENLARGCRRYERLLREQCEARRRLAAAKAMTSPAVWGQTVLASDAEPGQGRIEPEKQEGPADIATGYLTDFGSFYLEADGLYSKYKTAKTAWRLWSDVKKVNSAAHMTGEWACQNAAHMAAWMTLKGFSPIGAPLGPAEAAPRAFRAGTGAPGARTGEHLDPCSLFKFGDPVNVIGSESTTSVGADERLFLHGPIAVLAGMKAPSWSAGQGIDPTSIATGGGTAAVLGMDVALVASKKVTEVQSLGTVLVSGGKIDAVGKESLEISVGRLASPHRIRVDRNGLTLDIAEQGTAVTINAPNSSVTLNARSLDMKVEEKFSLQAKHVDIKAAETTQISGKSAEVSGDEMAAVGRALDKLRFTENKVTLGSAAPVSIAAPGLDVVRD